MPPRRWDRDWLLDLAVLEPKSDAEERARQAASVAPRATAGTGPHLGVRATLRRWLASDTLHAAGPAWRPFSRQMKVAASESPRMDAEHKSAWPVAPGAGDPSGVAASTAAHIRPLERTLRIAR